ncbi:hypothetical protein BGS_0475 [Beggiatoa sp. SS]|nr:hypothetical protein BGS_0475 [Beggiatoa sp. SS]
MGLDSAGLRLHFVPTHLTFIPRSLLRDGKITEDKAKFAQAREWDNNVVWGDDGLSFFVFFKWTYYLWHEKNMLIKK